MSVRPVLRPLLVDAIGIAGAACVLVVVVFQLWHRDLRVPLDYDGDGLLNGAWFKTVIETGWMNHTDRLGAPFGQTYYDFPLGGDNLHFLVLRAMTVFSGDYALLLNLFFFLTFPSVAVSAFVTQRWLGAERAFAAVSALVFALLPAHFYRGTEHIFLASYAVIPLGVLLAVRAGTGRMPWSPTVPGPRPLLRALPWLGVVVVVASCGSYYWVFSLVVVGVVAGLGALSARDWRPILSGAVTIGLAAIVFALNNLGSILYWRSHRSNPEVGARAIEEMDLYAMRPIELLSPQPNDRIPPLGAIGDKLTTPNVIHETTQFLGLVGAVGFVVILLAGVLLLVGRPVRLDPVSRILVVVTWVTLLLGVSGGFAWLGNLVDFTRIRAWSRMSIVIAFAALTVLAVEATARARALVERSTRSRVIAAVLGALIVVVAAVDQVPNPLLPHAETDGSTNAERDRAYFGHVEATMPPGAAIYMLPYRSFPEAPPAYLSVDYDLVRPYLNTQTLRWSYGGMRGRPEADWQEALPFDQPQALVDDVVTAGFTGVLVDRLGYPDGGAAIEAAITATTRAVPVVDPAERWAFFDITGYATALRDRLGDEAFTARGDQVLHAPTVRRTGCYPEEQIAGFAFTWCEQEGSLQIITDGRPRSVTLTASIGAPSASGSLTLTAGGRSTTFDIGPSGAEISLPIEITAERTTVDFSTDLPRFDAPGDQRSLYFQLFWAKVVPS